MQNAQTAQRLIARRWSTCRPSARARARTALSAAIITRPEMIPADLRRELAPIIGKYMND